MDLTKVTNRMTSGAQLSVLDYGAVGDGVTDDTLAIRAALIVGGNILFPPGTYIVDLSGTQGLYNNETEGVYPQSDMYIEGYGATLLAKPNTLTNGSFFKFTNCDNINISGLTLDANRDNRTVTPGAGEDYSSNSHSLWVRRTHNSTFKDMKIINCTYDGIYMRGEGGYLDNEVDCPTNNKFINVDVDRGFRNCASLISSRDCQFIGCSFTNALGVAPNAGMDIEPNDDDWQGNKGLKVHQCTFKGNARIGLAMSSPEFKPDGVTAAEPLENSVFSDLYFEDNGSVEILPGDSRGELLVAGNTENLTFNDITIVHTSMQYTRIGVVYVGGTSHTDLAFSNFRFHNINVNDPTTTACFYTSASNERFVIDGVSVFSANCGGMSIGGTESHLTNLYFHNIANEYVLGLRGNGTYVDGVVFDDCPKQCIAISSVNLTVNNVLFQNSATTDSAIRIHGFDSGAVFSNITSMMPNTAYGYPIFNLSRSGASPPVDATLKSINNVVQITSGGMSVIQNTQSNMIAAEPIMKGMYSDKDFSPYFNGTGTPEGVVAGLIGAIYGRKDGGAGTSLYVKESKGTTITAGSLVVGKEYEIKTLGDSDFRLVGALFNEIGIVFIATGVGAGTGTAYKADTGWVAK
jgi:hypothetical protein